MMQVIFIGHGSPMNAIEDNGFTKGWEKIAASIPRPEAILSVSAHWLADKTIVSTLEDPKTIHDFYGFPKALYDVEYKVKGSPVFAEKTIRLFDDIATGDKSRGLDHGTWSVLRIMYPKADIPVYQMSINIDAGPHELYKIGERLKPLRDSNVLIMGSGNVVHNLGILDFDLNGGYDWAYRIDDLITEKIEKNDMESILNHMGLDNKARLSVPTPDHFYPLLYILGAANDMGSADTYNKECVAGSISMTAYVFDQNI